MFIWTKIDDGYFLIWTCRQSKLKWTTLRSFPETLRQRVFEVFSEGRKNCGKPPSSFWKWGIKNGRSCQLKNYENSKASVSFAGWGKKGSRIVDNKESRDSQQINVETKKGNKWDEEKCWEAINREGWEQRKQTKLSQYQMHRGPKISIALRRGENNSRVLRRK